MSAVSGLRIFGFAPSDLRRQQQQEQKQQLAKAAKELREKRRKKRAGSVRLSRKAKRHDARCLAEVNQKAAHANRHKAEARAADLAERERRDHWKRETEKLIGRKL